MNDFTWKIDGKPLDEREQLVFDIETDGLIPEMTVIHSLVIKSTLTGSSVHFTDHAYDGALPIATGVKILMDAFCIAGHNIQGFDIPAIQKIYPWFKPRGIVLDTVIMSRTIYPDMRDADFRQAEKGDWIPPQMYGRHSLESWGYRLGLWKGDYGKQKEAEGKAEGLTGAELTYYVWGRWSPEMQDYCGQDVEVTFTLLQRLRKKDFSFDSILLEHDVQRIISRQEAYGWAFDEVEAYKLYANLRSAQTEIEEKLSAIFAPWYRFDGVMTPKADRTVRRSDLDITITERRFSAKTGKELTPYVGPVRETYHEGAPYTKIKMKPFNPTSRQDIANRLQKVYGWKPALFTPDGQPKVDDEVLSQLKYPAAPLLTEYLQIDKLTGMLSEGKGAWLKAVRDGRIHGRVNTMGTVTSRMTHSKPNMAQVPSGKVRWGHECRALFTASKGRVLVGCDADALELRCLAGYMARWDGGAYIKTILEGRKEDGTDMHTLNAKALGCDRDTAKTWIYAMLYGSGDFNLGTILGVKGSQAKVVAAGKAARQKLMKAFPALKKLVDACKSRAELGKLRGLDGRYVPIRSAHSALNTLLQSAGAIIMKKALVILEGLLTSEGFVAGVDYEFVGNIHDEWQIDTDPAIAERVGFLATEAIRLAGEALNFRCPLKGNYDIGANWGQTH
ncbi:DNA polymerase [Rhizobium rhizogenes]|uniref:DNA polymerase n=1 Tax=Rhizobium rhizogenes TaxID=359 RepID=UPI00191F6A05|nr:DNA polymerase [Rhizobium rhizogenes]